MSSRKLVVVGYLNLSVGVLSTVIYLLQFTFKEHIGLMIFMTWLLAPYLIIGLVLYKDTERHKILSKCVASIFSVVVGLYLLIDIRYIHPDPQGPLGMLMVPILQLIIFAVLTVILFSLLKKKSEEKL